MLKYLFNDTKMVNFKASIKSVLFGGVLSFFSVSLPFSDLFADDTEQSKSFVIESIDLSGLVAYPEHEITAFKIQEAYEQARSLFKEDLSLDDLSAIADDIGKLYRENGYKFHSVFIPPQKFSNNIAIRISMLVARLGDVNVKGEDEGLNDVIKLLFGTLIGKPLYQPDVDKVVLGIKSKYGITVFPYYSRGSKQGEVRLNIKATRTAKWVGSITADNFGSESTGKDRVMATATNYDLLGNLDTLSFGVLRAVDGESNTYGFINYELPIYSLDHAVSFSLSNNQFKVADGFESLGLEGNASLLGLTYHYVLTQTFDLQQGLSIGLDYKRNNYDSLFNDPLLEQDETSQSGSLSWSLNYRPIASRWSHSIYISLTGGEYELENIGDTTSFYKGLINQQFQWAWGDSNALWFSALKWGLKGQYSEDKLSSFELMSMSGAYGVRSIDAGYFGADRSAITHLEWWLPNLIPSYYNVKISPFIYYDVGYGERLSSVGEVNSRVYLEGGGVGFQAQYKKHFVLSFSSSLSMGSDVEDNPEPDEMHALLKLQYMIPH
jgi:hemolysin activation/secretion protein